MSTQPPDPTAVHRLVLESEGWTSSPSGDSWFYRSNLPAVRIPLTLDFMRERVAKLRGSDVLEYLRHLRQIVVGNSEMELEIGIVFELLTATAEQQELAFARATGLLK